MVCQLKFLMASHPYWKFLREPLHLSASLCTALSSSGRYHRLLGSWRQRQQKRELTSSFSFLWIANDVALISWALVVWNRCREVWGPGSFESLCLGKKVVKMRKCNLLALACFSENCISFEILTNLEMFTYYDWSSLMQTTLEEMSLPQASFVPAAIWSRHFRAWACQHRSGLP